MKKVLSYLKPYWFIAIWSPIFMVGEVLIDLELPTVMAQIVNEGIINGGGMDVILPMGIKMLIYVILGGIFGVGAAFSPPMPRRISETVCANPPLPR